MWQKVLKSAVQIACELLEDASEEERRKRVKELAMEIWEELDPTPNLDLDDWIVETIVEHLIDWMEDMRSSTKDLSLS